MKLVKKKNEIQTEKTKEKEVFKPEKPRDSTRWLSLLFLLISLFISYLSWVAYQG